MARRATIREQQPRPLRPSVRVVLHPPRVPNLERRAQLVALLAALLDRREKA